ncbi:MAG: hypothetical protein MJY92_06080 [Bacteroidales bacterium]|nr:hypothetical protein [Bacteroidales bacterium]
MAGHTFCICSIYAEVQEMCREYACQSTPEFTIQTTQDDIVDEDRQSDETRLAEGLPPHKFSESYLETLVVYRKLCSRLLQENILLFHGSAIAVDGKCYIFTARSGTGKSTHASLWRKVLGEKAIMVNDDKPLIHIRDGKAMVYGTPWNGKHHLGNNISAPLCGIALLQRDAKNSIRLVGIDEALPMLLEQSYLPKQGGVMLPFIELVGQLAQSAPLYLLRCNMEDDAVKVAYEGMTNEHI